MKINIYLLQRHTETGETREKFLIDHEIDGEKGIWRYQTLHVEGKAYQVQKICKSPNQEVTDVLCYEISNTGNQGLLKNLIM